MNFCVDISELFNPRYQFHTAVGNIFCGQVWSVFEL